MDAWPAVRDCAIALRILTEGPVTRFFKLLEKAIQSNGNTLRLCVVMVVAAAVAHPATQLAQFIRQLW